MVSMLLLSACEKAEIRSGKETQTPITTRGACEDCPGVDECCCGVWVQNALSGYASVSLCGTSDGADGCSGSAVGSCSSFSGGGQSF